MKKVTPLISNKNDDIEMNSKTTLGEDEDQGEMDTVFFLSLFIYTIYLSSIDLIYTDKKIKVILVNLI